MVKLKNESEKMPGAMRSISAMGGICKGNLRKITISQGFNINVLIGYELDHVEGTGFV